MTILDMVYEIRAEAERKLRTEGGNPYWQGKFNGTQEILDRMESERLRIMALDSAVRVQAPYALVCAYCDVIWRHTHRDDLVSRADKEGWRMVGVVQAICPTCVKKED